MMNGGHSDEACMAYFLRSDNTLPFVNREELRTAIQSLSSDRGGKVLVVDGPPVSGKSYSFELIAHVSNELGTYRAIRIDLGEGVSTRLGPADLVRSIALQMSLDPTSMPNQNSSGARWVIELCDWLAGQLRASNETWWIILDGVNQADLLPDTRDLITHCAQRAEVAALPLRIVLLGYKVEMLPPNLIHRVKKDYINGINESELKEFFKCFLESKGHDIDASGIDAIVNSIMDVLPADQHERMYALASAVEKAVKLLEI